MTNLQLFWTVIFAAAVFLFLAVEIVVVIGGASDLADMVRSLKRHSEERQRDERQDDTKF